MAARTEISQDTAIAVMGKLKQANEYIRVLHRTLKDGEKLIEEQLVSDPKNNKLKSLYLRTLSNNCRSKTVATFNLKRLNKNGVTYLTQESVSLNIEDNDYWQISLIAKGTAVRVHLTEKGIAHIQNQIDTRYPEKNYQDLKFY